jgi:hypothetical protein
MSAAAPAAQTAAVPTPIPATLKMEGLLKAFACVHLVAPQNIHKKYSNYLLDTLLSTEVQKLCLEAGQFGKWTIAMLNPNSGSKALTTRATRTIFLAPDLSQSDFMTHLVFELTNAAQSPGILIIERMAQNKLIGRNTFALLIEKLEYVGLVRRNAIFKSAVKELGWDPQLERITQVTDFATHWKYIKDTPHAEAYRKHYDLLYSK